MYNKFEVVLYRFHMKKKNTLLIKGYFEEGCKKNNSLKIMLDQKELNVAIDEEINQGIALSSELGTSRAKYIYELQVELPGNWEKGQKIRVINCLNEKEKEEYKISVAKLVKNKNRIEKYVECEKVSEKGFVIKGWCIYQNKVDIIVKDEKKNILPVKIKEKKRAGCLLYNGKYVYFDKNGYALESYEKKYDDVPLVTGLKYDELVMQEKIPVKKEKVFSYLLELTTAIDKYNLPIDQIYIKEDGNALLISDKITVDLYNKKDIDIKISELAGMLKKVKGKSGTIDMKYFSEDHKIAVFQPKKS